MEIYALADHYQFLRLKSDAFNVARQRTKTSTLLTFLEQAITFRAHDVIVMLLCFAKAESCNAKLFREAAILVVCGHGARHKTLFKGHSRKESKKLESSEQTLGKGEKSKLIAYQ